MFGLIDSLLSLGLLIVAAKLAEGLLGRIGVNSIFAYTLVGVLLGPMVGDAIGFQIITDSADLTTFLSVGIFLLFFLIGLDEIDIPSFVSTLMEVCNRQSNHHHHQPYPLRLQRG